MTSNEQRLAEALDVWANARGMEAGYKALDDMAPLVAEVVKHAKARDVLVSKLCDALAAYHKAQCDAVDDINSGRDYKESSDRALSMLFAVAMVALEFSWARKEGIM